MAYPADLTTIRDSLSAELIVQSAALNAALANPKPTYSAGGRSWSWTEYRARLVAQITELQAQIKDLTKQIRNSQGATETATIALT